MSKVVRIPAKRAPRMTPIEDVNNADQMLGAVLVGVIVALAFGVALWIFRKF